MVLDAPPLENSPAKILILDTAWLGDVVFTTSLIGAVKRQWPSSQVDLLVAPRGEPIVRHHPLLTQVRTYDKHGREKSLKALFRLGRELSAEKYDLVLNAHSSLRSRILTRLTNAPVRVGYEGIGARAAFTHVIPNDLALEPDHVARRINLLRALGIQASAEPLSVHVDPEEKQHAERFAEEHHINGRPLLGLICGSAWKTKQWSAANFGKLGERWVTERSGSVLVLGGEAERTIVERISTAIGPQAIPCIQSPLPFVAALLNRCDIVVGNDTGLSFLAIAAGCRQVLVMYGSTQLNYSFPAPHHAITAGVPCCLSRTGHGAQHCKWGDEPWCMAQISVERIWREVHP